MCCSQKHLLCHRYVMQVCTLTSMSVTLWFALPRNNPANLPSSEIAINSQLKPEDFFFREKNMKRLQKQAHGSLIFREGEREEGEW